MVREEIEFLRGRTYGLKVVASMMDGRTEAELASRGFDISAAAEEDLAAECRALADEIEAVSARAEDVFRRLNAFYRKWGRPE